MESIQNCLTSELNVKKRCGPKSTFWPHRSTDLAMPPTDLSASMRTISNLFSFAKLSAALMPAGPAPMTTTFIFLFATHLKLTTIDYAQKIIPGPHQHIHFLLT